MSWSLWTGYFQSEESRLDRLNNQNEIKAEFLVDQRWTGYRLIALPASYVGQEFLTKRKKSWDLFGNIHIENHWNHWQAIADWSKHNVSSSMIRLIVVRVVDGAGVMCGMFHCCRQTLISLEQRSNNPKLVSHWQNSSGCWFGQIIKTQLIPCLPTAPGILLCCRPAILHTGLWSMAIDQCSSGHIGA